MDYSIYLVLAPFTGATVLIALVLVLQRSDKRSARFLVFFISAALGYLIANYLELVWPTVRMKYLWASIEHFCVSLLPLAWLLFVFEFTERSEWTRPVRFLPLAIPGATEVILTVTNKYHHLIWRRVNFVPVVNHRFLAMQVEPGGVYIAYFIIGYAMFIAGLLVIYRELRGSFGIYRRQLILISLSMLVPMIFGAIYVTQIIPGLQKDFSPVAFGVAAILAMVALRSARFLEILPTSRSQIFNVLQDGIIVVDAKHRLVDMNTAAMSLLDLTETSLGRSARENETVAEVLDLWDHAGDSVTTDVTLHRDGEELHYEMHLRRRGKEGSRSSAVLIGIHDVTERVRREQSEVLLKEIHHRVKNNLQVISSLLFLQEDRTEDPAFRSILKDCRNQILSMAQIHEDLYRSKDFDNIDFAEYIRTLTLRLFSTFQSGRTIQLDLALETILLDIDKAIPCGLIINELCVNVLKHAFPPSFDGRPQTLRIELSEESGMIHVGVADNGVGMPEEPANPKQASLGMEMIETLVRQLHGSAEVERNNGTRFTVAFPRTHVGDAVLRS